MSMLDSSIQTKNYKPFFPIKIFKKFTFYKRFHNGRLTDLQKKLAKEWIYIEFIQWVSDSDGCALARFQTTLDELLYPKSSDAFYYNIDLDLLMEPTKRFPGTLGPKLLIKTQTTIEENECINYSNKINFPKMIVSSQPATKRNKPRRVCHSLTYNRSDRCWSDARNREVESRKFSVGSQSCDNLSSHFLKSNPDFANVDVGVCPKCKYNCPTCYQYENLVSTAHCNEAKKCQDRHCVTDNISLRETERNCVSCGVETASTLAKRLHQRLQECLCTNARLVREKCNDWVDLD